MRQKFGFISIFLGNIDLPIYPISVQYRSVTKPVNTLVNMQNQEPVVDRHYIHPGVDSEKAKSPDFSGMKPLVRLIRFGQRAE